MLPSDVSDDDVETLRSIVGDDLPESTLRALLLRSGGDVTAAANSFFDGGVATLSAMEEGGGASPAQPGACSVGDDVLSTLFKTLEDQGKKLAGDSRPARASTSPTMRPRPGARREE